MPAIPFNREEVIRELKEHVMKVQFVKANGETRILTCTLRPDMVKDPNFSEEYLKEQHDKYPDVVAAWDIDNRGWRGFRIDSVQWIETKDNLLYK